MIGARFPPVPLGQSPPTLGRDWCVFSFGWFRPMRAWARLSRWRSHSFVRFGLPFLVLTVGGSFILSEFTDVRFRYQRYRFVENEFEASGRVPGAAPTLEDEYQEYQREVRAQPDTGYEMIRGPRPWEQNNSQIAPAKIRVRPE